MMTVMIMMTVKVAALECDVDDNNDDSFLDGYDDANDYNFTIVSRRNPGLGDGCTAYPHLRT